MTKKSLTEIPMLSADGESIEEGMVLYTTEVRFDKYSKKEETARVISNRVFWVNNVDRCFRMRCPKGCESELSLRGGCSTTKVYATLSNAKDAVVEKLEAKLLEVAQDRDIISVNLKQELENRLAKNSAAQTKFKNFLREVKRTLPETPPRLIVKSKTVKPK